MGASAPMVLCNAEHRFLVAEQARSVGEDLSAIVLEPGARNTAPAIAVAALQARESGNDPVLLVLPAVHHIGDVIGFRSADQGV
jgi:mannose-1-phosphate guanylyltransferase